MVLINKFLTKHFNKDELLGKTEKHYMIGRLMENINLVRGVKSMSNSVLGAIC